MVQDKPVCAALYRTGDVVVEFSVVAAAPGEEGSGLASTLIRKLLDQMQQVWYVVRALTAANMDLSAVAGALCELSLHSIENTPLLMHTALLGFRRHVCFVHNMATPLDGTALQLMVGHSPSSQRHTCQETWRHCSGWSR